MKNALAPMLIAAALCGPGCSLLVDGTLAGRGGDTDAGMMDAPPVDAPGTDAPSSACGVAVDGTRCEVAGLLENRICLAGICVSSSCGDGFTETRELDGMPQEICDDGNGNGGDGCEPDCTYSCDDGADCDDGQLCNGAEDCNTDMHVCEAGEMAPNGTTCTVEAVKAECMMGVCRAGACPDGTTDAGEQCDDDNATAGDGCEPDCTFTCETDAECQDATVCNGAETCDTAAHTCLPATALVCDDEDVCTTDTCDATAGCAFTTIFVDGDGDGFGVAPSGAPATCVSEDCDDTNPLAYPGAPEACGTVDLNCDGSTAAPTYYADCDGDGYAASGALTMMSCTPPTSRPSGCPSGTAGEWTTRQPVSATSIDCADGDDRAFPRTSEHYTTGITGMSSNFDFDCDGEEETEIPIGRPRDYVECNGARTSCTGTVYFTDTRIECGVDRVAPFAPTSYCSWSTTTLRCARVAGSTPNVACH